MPEQPIMLKVLLGQRHWQNYATFCAEYDKAARKLDTGLVHISQPRAAAPMAERLAAGPAVRRPLPRFRGDAARLDR